VEPKKPAMTKGLFLRKWAELRKEVHKRANLKRKFDWESASPGEFLLEGIASGRLSLHAIVNKKLRENNTKRMASWVERNREIVSKRIKVVEDQLQVASQLKETHIKAKAVLEKQLQAVEAKKEALKIKSKLMDEELKAFELEIEERLKMKKEQEAMLALVHLRDQSQQLDAQLRKGL